jgi:transcriptional regulator with XRE-family HTH domain
MRLTELAKRLGISRSLLSEHERGTARVPASRLWEIAQVLHVPVGDFFEEEPEDVLMALDPLEH